jgi:hypothetical protein
MVEGDLFLQRFDEGKAASIRALRSNASNSASVTDPL